MAGTVNNFKAPNEPEKSTLAKYVLFYVILRILLEHARSMGNTTTEETASQEITSPKRDINRYLQRFSEKNVDRLRLTGPKAPLFHACQAYSPPSTPN